MMQKEHGLWMSGREHRRLQNSTRVLRFISLAPDCCRSRI